MCVIIITIVIIRTTYLLFKRNPLFVIIYFNSYYAFLLKTKTLFPYFVELRGTRFKGQHQCNSIDFWTFFLGWRKSSKKKRLEDVFGHVFKFPGKFCHWKISQNGGTGALLLQRVLLRHALELPQIRSWNKNNFFFLICISIARETRKGL